MHGVQQLNFIYIVGYAKIQQVLSNIKDQMKIDKYDRQLRIWGPKGQKALAQSSIAVIGCSGPAIQAAKNLILPGIGKIDIWDNQIIQLHNLAESFFYQNDSVGKHKAEEASKQLLQMNPDVNGQFFIQPPQYLIDKPEVLNNYSLIIAGNLSQAENKSLSEICWKIGKPVIFITAVGFIFHIRVQKRTHIVQSQNISAKKYYLQLDSPFQSLKNYCQNFKVISLQQQLQKNQLQQQKTKISQSLSKIPYPVLLYESYKQAQQKKSSQVKEVLIKWKNLLNQSDRHNFNQAISRTFDLFQTPDNFLPNFDIINDQNVINSNGSSQFIFIFLKAVGFFYEKNKKLPQPLKLPDIHASTKDYLDLKNTYKTQHLKNRQQIKSIILNWYPNYMIDEDLTSSYIDNIDALQIIKMKPYFEQLQNPDTMGSCINYLADQKNLLLALSSYQKFYSQKNKSPTSSDVQRMTQIAQQLKNKWSIDSFDEKYIQQVCRYSGKTMISLSSIAGAIAGQQCIKLITKCFAPLNNGYFFDGIKCKGYSLAL